MRRGMTLSSDPAPTPRELLASLAGRSTWTTGAGGWGGVRVQTVTPDAALQVGLAWAAREEPVGAMIATAIAVGDAHAASRIAQVLAPILTREMASDHRYKRLVAGERGLQRLLLVVEDAARALVTGRPCRTPRGMRAQDWWALYRIARDIMDLLAQTAELVAVNYLR